MRVAVFLLALLAWSSHARAADLCVKTGGSDATAKASISYVAGNEAGSTCWATILRAVRGAAERSPGSAVSGEAAAAGDTVYVFAGTYASAENCDDWGTCRFEALYEPINAGTSGNTLDLVPLGVVRLECPACDAPSLGGSTNYVRWLGDLSLSRQWVIPGCFETPGGADDCTGAVHAFTPDTGPVTASATGLVFRGVVLTLSNQGIGDNVPAVRFEGCDGCEFSGGDIDGFTMSGGGNHAPCFQLYNSINSLFQQNRCRNGSSGFSFKDQTAMTGTNNLVRWNWFSNLEECGHWSVIQAGSDYGGTYVYSNVFTGVTGSYCVNVIAASLGAQGFINNVIYSAATAGFAGFGATDEFYLWNNIVSTVTNAIYNEAPSFPAVADLSAQHNVYHAHSGNFYQNEGGDTNRATLAAFVAVYTTQETETPAGRAGDPLFVDAAGGDFRLCTGAGTPAAGCSGASSDLARGVDRLDLDGDLSTSDTIPAGACVSGTETIGTTTTGMSCATGALPGTVTIPARTFRIHGADLAGMVVIPFFLWRQRR